MNWIEYYLPARMWWTIVCQPKCPMCRQSSVHHHCCPDPFLRSPVILLAISRKTLPPFWDYFWYGGYQFTVNILRKRIRATPCFFNFLFVDFNLGKIDFYLGKIYFKIGKIEFKLIDDEEYICFGWVAEQMEVTC